MNQELPARIEFWSHLTMGIMTIGAVLGLGVFVSGRVADGVFPWWVYGAFALYTLAVFFIDHILFCRKK